MKRETRQLICNGIFAGLMIGIGCAVYLASENKLAGAVMFSAGLFFILSNGGTLLTGICGLKTPWLKLAVVLGLNTIGALIAGALTWPTMKLAQPAATVVMNKMAAHPLSWLTNGILCGMLVHLAVMGYKRAKDSTHALASVLYAIPAFIVAGFEHSIADIGYLAIAIPALNMGDILRMIGMIAVVIAGNVIGSKALRICMEDAQQ